MEKLKINLDKLKFLSSCNKKLFSKILKSADKALIQTLNEYVINTLNCNVNLSVLERMTNLKSSSLKKNKHNLS